MLERSERKELEGHPGEGVVHRVCRCPNCGFERVPPPEIPCYAMKCPRCGAPMSDM